MKRDWIPVAVALLLTGGLVGCQNGQADSATVAMLSDVTIGSQIGPLPGADRPATHIRNPYADDPAARAEGFQLFNWYNCSGCHGDHAGGGMGPSLRDSLWYYGGDDASIFASITEGRQHGMPAWGSKLPRDQIWKLVTYIRSLRTPDEPDPPRE